MSIQEIKPVSPSELRMRAHSHLTGHSDPTRAVDSASAALKVLHDLAVSPETAADALAVLHELQVYQVELDLQYQALRASSSELEAALARQVQLFECAPVSLFNVDIESRVYEVNLTGAQQLGVDREALLGQALDSFLAAHSAPLLLALLARVGQGPDGQTIDGTCELSLMAPANALRRVWASANADPSGQGYLLAFMDLGPLPKT
jgi:PAS domain-containing protein